MLRKDLIIIRFKSNKDHFIISKEEVDDYFIKMVWVFKFSRKQFWSREHTIVETQGIGQVIVVVIKVINIKIWPLKMKT